MRWLLVSSQHHPTHGGIGTYVARFCASAVDAGWHVELLTRPSNFHPPGVVVHEVPTSDLEDGFNERLPALRQLERVRPYRYGLWSLAVAKRLLEIHDAFDAVEFVDTQAEGYVSLASHHVRRHLRKIAKAAIIHAHTPMFVEEQINGADSRRFGRSIYHEWEMTAIASADGVMTASDLLRQRLPMSAYSRTIPYPISIQSPIANQSTMRDQTIVLVGSVQPRKGVHVWARSLNRVFREHPAAKALLIGPDTFTAPDGGSMAECVRELVDASVGNRFHWLGPLQHHQVMSHVSQASLVVVPSLFDNAPFVVTEALGCGTPVIVSDQVGWIEVVPEIPTVKAGDAEALAEMQCTMLADLLRSQRKAIDCRERLMAACDSVKHLQRRAAFIDELAGSKRPVSADHAAADVMDEMASFLTSIEAEERSMCVASSARS